MATPFGSFNASPLGGFIQSPLGARGNSILRGDFFHGNTGISNQWRAADPTSWTNLTGLNIGAPYLFSGARLLTSLGYSDSPYTSVVSYSGSPTFRNQAPCRGIRKFNGNFYIPNTLAANFYTSTNNGATWSTVSLPNSAGGAVGTVSRQIFSVGATLYVLIRSSTANRHYFATSTDGVNFTGLATMNSFIGGGSGVNVQAAWYYGGSFYIYESGQLYSSPDGVTFTFVRSMSLLGTTDYCFWDNEAGTQIMFDGNGRLSYSTNAFVTSHTNSSLLTSEWMLDIDGALYGVLTASGYPVKTTNYTSTITLQSLNIGSGSSGSPFGMARLGQEIPYVY